MRLTGSIPCTMNGRVIGKAFIIGTDDKGMVVDIQLSDLDFMSEVTHLVNIGDLPAMSFGFVIDPVEHVCEPDCGV